MSSAAVSWKVAKSFLYSSRSSSLILIPNETQALSKSPNVTGLSSLGVIERTDILMVEELPWQGFLLFRHLHNHRRDRLPSQAPSSAPYFTGSDIKDSFEYVIGILVERKTYQVGRQSQAFDNACLRKKGCRNRQRGICGTPRVWFNFIPSHACYVAPGQMAGLDL